MVKLWYVPGWLAILFLGSNPVSGQTSKPAPDVTRIFDKEIAAVIAGDKDAFVADATDAVKKAIDKDTMTALKDIYGKRLQKGFDATFLCALKQRGDQVYLWKLTMKDGGDDIVVRIALDKGKVDGFFFQ